MQSNFRWRSCRSQVELLSQLTVTIRERIIVRVRLNIILQVMAYVGACLQVCDLRDSVLILTSISDAPVLERRSLPHCFISLWDR
jgi:hypothetical protein